MTSSTAASIPFAGSTLRGYRHVCAFFSSPKEEYDTLLPFIRDGNDWIEYESRLNDVLPRYDDPVICTYDANLLSGAIAVDILRTHPVAIIGGLLHENPFFVRPDVLLREVVGRSGATPTPYRGNAGGCGEARTR